MRAILVAFLLFPISSFSQTDADTAHKVDIIDIIWYLVKIKLPRPDTARIPPGKILLSTAPAAGYTLEGSLSGVVSVNGSFFTGDRRYTNMSVTSLAIEYSIKNQFIVSIVNQIWLPRKKYVILTDWRFYRYPSYTFGVGNQTSPKNADYVRYSYLKGYQEILKHFARFYFLGMGYDVDYHFAISDPDPVTNYPQYSGTIPYTVSSGLVAHFMYDSRTNINNPKKAFYASLLYRFNPTWLGSDNKWAYLQVEARKYFRLSENKVLAFWSWNEFTFGSKAPYFDLPSNGWDTYSNTGRGYLQGRFRGTDMIYGEAEFRFGILNNGLLGGVVFLNGTCITGWPVEKFGPVYPGEGIGLRIKFNKYSDVNVCIDYGFGEEGSHGFFFNLGEVF